MMGPSLRETEETVSGVSRGLIPSNWYQIGGFRGTTTEDKFPCKSEGTTQNHNARDLRVPFCGNRGVAK